MKRIDILWGAMFTTKTISEKDIDAGYDVFRSYLQVTALVSGEKVPMKDRAMNLVKWNETYKSFFYLSPYFTGIIKDLENYKGEDKDEIEKILEPYLVKEDRSNIVKIVTPGGDTNEPTQEPVDGPKA
jgi:hypothetical protein